MYKPATEITLTRAGAAVADVGACDPRCGHHRGARSHSCGREAGLELREDIGTVREPGTVMEPRLTLLQGQPGAGGYCQHDVLVMTKGGADDITHSPYGPADSSLGTGRSENAPVERFRAERPQRRCRAGTDDRQSALAGLCCPAAHAGRPACAPGFGEPDRMSRPLLLLLGTGAALGLNFPVGKLAMAAGVNPALWAAVISLGAGLALLGVTCLTERLPGLPAVTLRFAVISGFVSFVLPNFLTFLVIPHIGSGLAAIMFALSPLVTALLSTLLRVRPPNRYGLAGIGLGLAGALIIIFGKPGGISLAREPWILLALLIPVFLGVGNVYRTLAWPVGASPRSLASFTNLAAVPFLLGVNVAQTGWIDPAPLVAIPGLIVVQLVVSTTMFLMFFRLQQIGGPTYLSQIGYVAAAVGMVIGMTVLGEVYPVGVWIGAAAIAAGIALSTFGQVVRR